MLGRPPTIHLLEQNALSYYCSPALNSPSQLFCQLECSKINLFQQGKNLRDSSDFIGQTLAHYRVVEKLGILSPDGRWLAYVSDESGRLEVYVRSFPDLDQKRQISTDGGIEPAWLPDDRELYYRGEDGRRIMVVPITAEPQFSPGRPELLFEGDFAPSPWYGRNFDVAADGQTFLMVEFPLPDDLGGEVTVMVNWFDELERIAAAQ